MASYTRANIITQARAILNEPTARFYSDTELQQWTDIGARILSAITLCYEVSEEIQLTDETAFESLTTDLFMKVESAVYNNLTGLQRIDPRATGHVGDAGSTGLPAFYWTFDEKIWLDPTPDATAGAASLDVYGYGLVGSYGKGAAELLPDEVQFMVIDFAVSMAYTKAGKHRLAGTYMQKFMQNAMLTRRDIYDNIGNIDSNDKSKIPDTTIAAQ